MVLLAEMPFLNFDPVDCLADTRRSSCDPSTSLVIDADYAALESAAADAAGASVLSLNGVLCPGRSCPVVVDDMVVFRDQHHSPPATWSDWRSRSRTCWRVARRSRTPLAVVTPQPLTD